MKTRKAPTELESCLLVLTIAVAHFIASVVALLVSETASDLRFGPKGLGPPSLFDRIMEALTMVLNFPIVTLFPCSTPGIGDYLQFVLNSIVWAICIYSVSRLLLRQFFRHGKV